jgi:hypothetical protein
MARDGVDDDDDTKLDCEDEDCATDVTCEFASPLDSTIAPDFHDAVRFLYEGPQPGTHVTLAYHGDRTRGWDADRDLDLLVAGGPPGDPGTSARSADIIPSPGAQHVHSPQGVEESEYW